MTEAFLATRAARKLKYSVPNIRTLTEARLTEEMKGFLRENMDPDRLANDEEVAEVWMRMDEEEEAAAEVGR